MAAHTPWVAAHARLSSQKDDNDNIPTQIEKLEAYAAEHYPGVTLRIYADDGQSAAKYDSARPNFRRMLADISSVPGCVAVIAPDQDRIARDSRWWDDFTDLCWSAGIGKLETYREGSFSLKPGERDLPRLKVVLSKGMVEGIIVKVNEKLEKNAERGIPSAGTPYGYKRDRLRDPVTGEVIRDENGRSVKTFTVVPEQRDVLLTMARMVLDEGQSVTAVRKWLNDEGHKSASGGRWKLSSVRSVLTCPSQAGLRVFKGRVVGNGNWAPIFDLETHEALKAKLGPQGKTRHDPRPARRRYLLSGLIWCAPCNERMAGGTRSGKSRYRCFGCHASIAGPQTEAKVVADLMPKLRPLVALLGLDDVNEDRRSEIEQRLTEIRDKRERWGEMLANDDMDEDTYAAARRKSQAEEEALRSELAGIPTPETVVSPPAVAEGWSGMTTDEKRATLGRFIERIEITPYHQGDGRSMFDPSRVRIVTKVRARPEDAVPALRKGRAAFIAKPREGIPTLADEQRFWSLCSLDELEQVWRKWRELRETVDLSSV